MRALRQVSDVCAPSALDPCARKQTLSAVATTWKWRARVETAGSTASVGNLAITVLQLKAPAALGRRVDVQPQRRCAPAVNYYSTKGAWVGPPRAARRSRWCPRRCARRGKDRTTRVAIERGRPRIRPPSHRQRSIQKRSLVSTFSLRHPTAPWITIYSSARYIIWVRRTRRGRDRDSWRR
jgi:hypothetical protein